jgi:competence protein CoiA
MLTALKEDGERICLGDGWQKEGLKDLRKKEVFSCPQCREKMILKLGDKRIFHFSHIKGSQCQFEHERESEYHLKGKMQLYHWLKQQQLKPEMEYYDPKMKQRADVIFFIGTKKFALEYQCSNISESLYRKRTNGYLANGYTPIWILGAKQLIRKKANITTLTEFHYLFLQKYSSNIWVIPYYCSETQMFIFQRSIQPISIRNTLSDLQLVKRDEITFNQFISPTVGKSINLNVWIKELQSLKNKLIQFKGSHQNPLLTSLYQSHLNLFLLPPYVGLPIRNSLFILSPSLIWQTFLFIDVFIKWDVKKPIRFHDIYIAFMKRKLQNHIQIRNLPQLREESIISVIHGYVQLLVRTGFLKRVNQQTYLLNQSVTIPQSVSEQLEMEVAFYKKYEKIIKMELQLWT